ncbi:MAG: transcriptional repressor LexA [Eubacteriales bacterium]|nr:transcriptional repressor LexA [Eubacteriales bacterium]MDD4475701.1 transcriptional repressor LexA [Eubacteriales bacterium]
MRELNNLEEKIYRYIRDNIEREGFPPSIRDICAAVSVKSTSTVHSYIDRLVSKGYLTKDDGKSRAIRLTSDQRLKNERMLRVPILGQVRAGAPILAVENYEGYVDFPAAMSGSSDGLFALKVIGESMIEAGILQDDIVIVQSRQFAENGDIVVAMIEDEATVKYFYRENGMFRLQPANSTMKPIIVCDVTILGKVIANYRFY